MSVGAPFRSRRTKEAGLTFPKVKVWSTFVCELCTVRRCLDRELHGPDDWKLLCYERMRLIDMAHKWALGTHKTYQGKLKILRQFEGDFGVTILATSKLKRPATSPSIALAWSQLRYSLQQTGRRRKPGEPLDLLFGTVRPLRSAASQFVAWDLACANPGNLWHDTATDRLVITPVRFTDDYSSSLFAKGLSVRIGADSKPAVALLERHVRFLDRDLDARFLRATTRRLRIELARAGLANLTFWLAWLRSSEGFGLKWCDCRVTDPGDGAIYDLPTYIGVILLSLDPETKSSRDHRADVILAWMTWSGLSWGRWFHRLRQAVGIGHEWSDDNRLLFCNDNGSPWTSAYFRKTYLIPSLETQRNLGDTYLLPYDGSPGNTLAARFWSIHA